MIKKITLFLSVIISVLSNAQVCKNIQIKDSRGDDNVVVDCSYPFIDGNCLVLSLDLPDLKKTNVYNVVPISLDPPVAYNAGTAMDVVGDDLFVKAVDIPFNFCFFGETYNQIVVGTNGMVSFNKELLGTTNYSNISTTIPSDRAPFNSIFGVFQDLIFTVNDDNGNPDVSEIYYSVIGDAPCRKFVISYYQVRVAGCENRINAQIVLHEGSNIVEVFTDGKPLACASALHKDALIGIQNKTGTLAYTPPGRNTGSWSAGKEAWGFYPNGEIIVPEIKWLDENGTVIGNSQNVKVCPNKKQTYSVVVSYDTCENEILRLTDTIDVDFSPDYPNAEDYTHVFCESSNSIIVNIDDDVFKQGLVSINSAFFNYSYFLTLADATSQTNPQSTQNVLINGNEKYFVRVSHPDNPNCYRISVLSFEFISNTLKTNLVSICDVNNDGTELNFNLSSLNQQLFDGINGANIAYFYNQQDAQNNANNITVAAINANTSLWIRIEIKGCVKVFGPIAIRFESGPNVVTPFEYTIELCDYKGDKTEEFDFHAILDALIIVDPLLEIKYFSTLMQAQSGMGTEVTNVKDGLQTVYARVNFPNEDCYSIIEVKLTVDFKIFEANNKDVYLCFDGEENVTIDLKELSLGMLVEPFDGILFRFFANENDAELLENELPSQQLIEENGIMVTRNYVVRMDDDEGCYIFRKLKVTLVNTIISKDNFQVCDVANDGVERVVLSSLDSEIKGGQVATVQYFINQQDAENNVNPIIDINLSGSLKLYVRVVVFNCYEVFPITINLVGTPVVKPALDITLGDLCDNNNDGVEAFDLTLYEHQIYQNINDVNFFYYQNYNASDHTFSELIINPKSFSVGASKRIYVKVEFKNGKCNSVSIINLSVSYKDPIVLRSTTLKKCDFEQDLSEVYNLSEAIPRMFLSQDNILPFSDMIISYHLNFLDANLGINPQAVLHVINSAEEIIYVRFQSSKTGCYSVKDLKLITVNPPKAINSVLELCDNNLNGIKDINLLDYRGYMLELVSDNLEDYTFSFYRSEADAETMTNVIQSPDHFEVDPFPGSIWVRIESILGCYNLAEVKFKTVEKVALSDSGPFVINDVCDTDNDGKEVLDLTQFESRMSDLGQVVYQYFPTLEDLNNHSNEILNPSEFLYDASVNLSAIVVKVSFPGLCPRMVEISVQLKSSPVFEMQDYYFCEGTSFKIETDISHLNIVSYEWRNPEGEIISTNSSLDEVNKAGRYSLKVVSINGCSYAVNFNVIANDVPVIKELLIEGKSCTVVASGGGKTILYSIDGVNWQLSNVFRDLPSGVIDFYVKFDETGCLGLVKQGLILEVINTFTPNGDGYNDKWELSGFEVFDGKASTLKIYNRVGTLIFEESSKDKFVWDGYFSGRKLPTDSYWYVLTMPDGRIVKGWILLKNR